MISHGHWDRKDVERIDLERAPASPIIARSCPLLSGVDLWDYWPVQFSDGHPAHISGGTLFIALSAPFHPDPDGRHSVARLRLLLRKGEHWQDLGLLLPSDFSPGSREWSGSAILSSDRKSITLYYTAAGVRGEATVGFLQTIHGTRASLDDDGASPSLSAWSEPTRILVPDGDWYATDMIGGGAVGTIKAFRDPGYFRDPADGKEYLLFAASLARSTSPWNGAVGIAQRTADERWELLPPLFDADGVNNELERPHIVAREGLYYLFWSTQGKVFADGLVAPTGLYGMVADTLFGPWRPINGSGLVFGNPPGAPFQAYSWLVLPTLCVQSFADLVGLAGPPADVSQARAHFAGTPAPELQLALDGDRAWLVR